MTKIDKAMTLAENQLLEITQRYIDQNIDLDVWVISIADVLKELTVLQAQKGKGRDKLIDNDIKNIKEYLSDVFTGGTLIDRDVDLDTQKIKPEKVKFGLNKLVKEINKGNVSDKELLNRIQLYGEHTRTLRIQTELESKVSKGYKECLNILQQTKGSGIDHHDICIHAASLGWTEIESFKNQVGLPPRAPNCICTLVYR